MGRKHCEKKEKLLVMSNFSFFHSVFKGLVQYTCKKGLFGKGLTLCQTVCFSQVKIESTDRRQNKCN